MSQIYSKGDVHPDTAFPEIDLMSKTISLNGYMSIAACHRKKISCTGLILK